MEEVFKERYNVNPNIVADVHQYIYRSAGKFGEPLCACRMSLKR
jgi:ferredoxin-thioredoxin reductase catalytic subunit